MRLRAIRLAALGMAALAASTGAFAAEDQKLAQTGMQFLSIVSDARATGMAGAVTTVPMQSASLFFNPATMTSGAPEADLSASWTRWIADITHYTGSVSITPSGGDYGSIGLSMQWVDYGEVQGTIVAPVEAGFVDTELLKPTAMALGLGYAKALSEAFSVGAQVKWVRQDLGTTNVTMSDGSPGSWDNSLNHWAVDFGTLFRTGFKSLAFGVAIRNFSFQAKYAEEEFQLPMTFTLGLSMDAMDFLEDRSTVNAVLVSVDATHYRDYYEQVFIGAEVTLLKVLALRGGFVTSSDEGDWTLGVGIRQYGIGIDYSYVPFGVFDNIQRFTLRYAY
jgi:hypothetical protein